jgi:hypothetical protein
MAKHTQGPRRTLVCAMSAFLLLVGLGSELVRAQSATATISGTVTDSSGAVVGDAAVQARNVDSGFTQTVQTDTQGRYRIAELGIGSYELQASETGFQTLVHSGITLTVGSQSVVDFALTVGQAQQTVTVQGEVEQVETESTAVGTLVDQTQMRELPLNGRNFGELILLAPGVQAIAGGNSFYGKTDNYSIAGSRPEGQAFLMDNVNISGFWNHGTGSGALGTQLGVDAIAEFQTLTNTYSAQFGGNGAVINAVTKSGTNQFHGSAYEFLRNSALDARNFFDLQNIAPFRRNQFGGTVGGPIRKDKAFFFVNYEGLRQSLGETKVAFVPDANARNGYLPCATAPGAPCNPTTGLADVGVAPNVASTLALYPAAQQEIGGGVGEVTSVANQIGHENYFLGRFDYVFSTKDSLFMRYVRDTANLIEPFSGSNIPLWAETDVTANHFATIEERHIVSPTLINLARISYIRPSDGGADTTSTPPLQYFPGRENGQVTLGDGSISTIGANLLLPFSVPENKFYYADDVLWTHGAHSIKMGMEVERVDSNTYAPFLWGGQWTFPSLQALLQGTAATVVSALPGQEDGYKDFRELFLTPYFQDDWKVNSKLTINMGLRYEYETNPLEVRHQMTAFLTPPYGGFQPVTHAFATNPSTKNFNPRIGLAYDPFADHKTSIRAGFGLFHDLLLPRLYDPGYWLNPPYAITAQLEPNYPAAFSGAGVLPPQPSQVEGMYYYFPSTPYVVQYNFNIQHDLGGGNILTVGYVGSEGVHLVQSVDFNPPPIVSGTISNPVFNAVLTPAGSVQVGTRLNPADGSLSEKTPIAHSHYNSLQASLNRRFSHGLQLQVSYTYSKSIDDGSTTYGLEGAQPDLPNPYYQNSEVGRSLFDRTHSLRASYVYALPFHGNKLVEGWQWSGIFTAVSGAPVDILDGPNMTGETNDRPDLLPGFSGNPVVGKPTEWLNPNAFALEPLGTLGNLGRDTGVGPDLWSLDTAFMKETRIGEGVRVQFRAEFFNIFNHTNFDTTNMNLGVFQIAPGGAVSHNPTFGQFVQTATTSRQIQFGIKVLF